MLENVTDPATRGDRQIDASRLTEDMGELLTGFADRRGVDQRHIGGGVGHQHREKQGLVAGLQIREDQVFLEVALEFFNLGVAAGDLQIDIGHRRRQQAFEAIFTALGLGEGCAFIQTRVMQQAVAGDVLLGGGVHLDLQCTD